MTVCLEWLEGSKCEKLDLSISRPLFSKADVRADMPVGRVRGTGAVIIAAIRQGLSHGQFRVVGLRHCTGTSAGAPLSLIKSTRNFAGWVVLAFRSTT